ncbi:MAG: hypothetical protein O2809_06430 [Proteobacteria bacterium]|nr:hypothetical protein [Pseudomonadota bacterium]
MCICQTLAKYKRNILLTLLGVLLLTLQICVNPSGYNYISYLIIAIVISYFAEIKSFSAGVFKIEKYEKIATHIDESVISFYRTLLKVTFNQQKSFFAQENILFNNYEDIAELFESINKLSGQYKKVLNEDLVECAKKTIKIQRNFLQGEVGNMNSNFDTLVEFSQLQIPEDVKSKPDFNKAKSAYEYLYQLVQNGGLKC